MKPFPWGLLFLVLAALDLVWTLLYLFRKRLAKWLCRRALARGRQANVMNFLSDARTSRLIEPDEELAWLKEFGLESQ